MFDFRNDSHLPKRKWKIMYEFLEDKFVLLKNREDYININYMLGYNTICSSLRMNYNRSNPYPRVLYKVIRSDHRDKDIIRDKFSKKDDYITLERISDFIKTLKDL